MSRFTPLVLLAFLFTQFDLVAQKKDSLLLTCLLDHGVVTEPAKPGVDMGTREMKIILGSDNDTLVKSCIDAVVSTVQRDEDGKWEIVFSHKNYWFWLSGLSKAVVRKNQKVKTGETLGLIEYGDKIELLLYDFETPLDPKKYMRCPN